LRARLGRKRSSDRHRNRRRTSSRSRASTAHIDERDLIAGALAELGERGGDPVALSAIGEVATRYKDARASLLLGKGALSRGLPLEHYAFPTVGLPEYRAIGPAIEPAVAYAIARQESTFNQKTVSSARHGPDAGHAGGRSLRRQEVRRALRREAHPQRPIYNMQLGAAELGDLIADYRGSYILTFVGYNAGRGRVSGSKNSATPRSKVDPIDWVERIPFSETRNYVQRVLENLQVYRVRFGAAQAADRSGSHRGAAGN
jgi:soluble lytic murein transglycosylase